MASATYDFYLGCGPGAQWLGSGRLDRCCCQHLDRIADSVTADEYNDLVLEFLTEVERGRAGTAHQAGDGWAWPWPSSHGTDWTYAFDDGAVWVAEHARRWETRSGEYLPPEPDETPLVLPVMGGYCRFTGLDAADTLARRYGPLLGDTYDLDLHQLAVRILADLTLPARPSAPDHEGGRWAALPPHLRYAITVDETAVELDIEVFGYRDGDPAAHTTEALLATLPARYGWTDPDGGPPRFGVRVTVADDDRHTTHPVLGDHRTRAVLTSST